MNYFRRRCCAAPFFAAVLSSTNGVCPGEMKAVTNKTTLFGIVSKYFFLFFALTCTNKNLSAQYYLTHRQDTVRWFIGKWINKKTFKIDSTINGNGGNGGTISVSEDGSLDISTPALDNFNAHINSSISDIDKAETALTKTIKEAEGIYQFNLANESIKELEKIKEDFKLLVEKPAKAPPLPKNALDLALEKYCNDASPEYHRIINFYKAHRSEKNPHYNLPVPPVADYFNCYSCNQAKRIEYDTLCQQFRRAFFKEEYTAIKFLLYQVQTMDATGIGAVNDGTAQPEVKAAYDSTSSHHGPCSYISYFDMTMALEYYHRRCLEKVKQLWEENINNYGAYFPVLNLCLSAYQQEWAIGGISDKRLTRYMEDLAVPLEHLYDSMTNLLVDKRDYRLMGSIPFLIGAYNTILALASRGTVNGELLWNIDYRPKCSIETLIGFPQFELTIELDAKTGSHGSYVITHFKSRSRVVADLDSNQCVKFTLGRRDNGKIIAYIITNEAISPPPVATYVGTKEYTSQSPVFKIHFCPVEGIPDGDSLYLSTFTPMAPSKGNWNVQGRMVPSGINQVDRLFINVEELKNEAFNFKPEMDQKKLHEIQKNAVAMAEKIKQLQANGNTDPAKMAEMVKQLMNNSGAVVETQTAALMRIRLPLTVNNMTRLLIDQKFDAKLINPSMADAIVYAYLTIKLKHTPNRDNYQEEDLQ